MGFVDDTQSRVGGQADISVATVAGRDDLLTLGIACASILLFAIIGAAVVPPLIDDLMGRDVQVDQTMVSVLVLNIALVCFGWSRYRDLTAELQRRIRAERAALALADLDPLTHCHNRRSINREIEAMYDRVRTEKREVAVMLFDLDNFKQVNDWHGHQAGDAVLIECVSRIQHQVPSQAIVARLGGDEFACATIFELGSESDLETFASRICEALSKPIVFDDTECCVTISGGLARTRRDDDVAEGTIGSTLLHRADMAMYRAKKAGKNRWAWFEPAMEMQLQSRKLLETRIRIGLDRGEFVPFYEQQVDLHSGRLVGFEMLARWRSPDLGLVAPDVFLPVVEEMGLMEKFCSVLFAQAFDDAAGWDNDLTLSVNVSSEQLTDPWFAQKLLKLLVAANFPPSRLEIEMTEACLTHDLPQLRQVIESLRNQGISIGLDDFGTGYSSLSQLRELPFDRLKIDRSFLASLLSEDRSAGSIVDTILELGQKLDKRVTVEGIETEEILLAFRERGPSAVHICGQGYHYGLPEDAQEVRARLQSLSAPKPHRPMKDMDRMPFVEDDVSRAAAN